MKSKRIMELTNAIVVNVLPLERGTRQDGTSWQNRKVIVRDSLPVPYPDEVVVTFRGDRATQIPELKTGDHVKIGWSSKVYERKFTAKSTNEERTVYEQDNTGFSVELL